MITAPSLGPTPQQLIYIQYLIDCKETALGYINKEWPTIFEDEAKCEAIKGVVRPPNRAYGHH